jgi:hypothetical protein
MAPWYGGARPLIARTCGSTSRAGRCPAGAYEVCCGAASPAGPVAAHPVPAAPGQAGVLLASSRSICQAGFAAVPWAALVAGGNRVLFDPVANLLAVRGHCRTALPHRRADASRRKLGVGAGRSRGTHVG